MPTAVAPFCLGYECGYCVRSTVCCLVGYNDLHPVTPVGMLPFIPRKTQLIARVWFGVIVRNGYIFTHFGHYKLCSLSDINRIHHPSYLYETAKIPPIPITPPTIEIMTANQAPSVPSHAEFYPRVRSFTDWPKVELLN